MSKCNTTHYACDCQIERCAKLEAENKSLRAALEKMEDQGSRCNTCNCWEIAKEALAPSSKGTEGKE